MPNKKPPSTFEAEGPGSRVEGNNVAQDGVNMKAKGGGSVSNNVVAGPNGAKPREPWWREHILPLAGVIVAALIAGVFGLLNTDAGQRLLGIAPADQVQGAGAGAVPAPVHRP